MPVIGLADDDLKSMIYRDKHERFGSARLSQAVPVSLLLIFLILFVPFGNIKDSLLVLNNVPFAMVGEILALLATGINFNISAGIGFIALFGICVQNGVILITRFKTNISDLKHKPEWTFIDAIRDGLETRIRPVIFFVYPTVVYWAYRPGKVKAVK